MSCFPADDMRRIHSFLSLTSVYSGVKRCGQVLPGTASVSVVRNELGKGKFRGLRRCGSYWVCPDCAAATTRKRFDQVNQVLAGVAAEGHEIEFITLTLAHYKRDKLADLLRVIQDAWKDIRKVHARALRGWKYIRALEIKWDFKSGWHAHFHLASWGAERGSLNDWIETEWVTAVRKFGGRASEAAQLVKRVERVEGCAAYLTKELTITMSKEGDSLHPFEVLRRAAAGDSRMGAVWKEYETALKTRKTRWLVFSTGLLPTYVDLDEPEPGDETLGIIPLDSFVQLADSEKDVIRRIVDCPISNIKAVEAIGEFMKQLNLVFLPPSYAARLQRDYDEKRDRLQVPKFHRDKTWSRQGGRAAFTEKNCVANLWEQEIERLRLKDEAELESLAQVMMEKRQNRG